ncbi:hypothetical protein TrRE_jg3330 [Triparma retinervis]|uniref:Ubiquitin-like protein ATG12 n=1 Tax=Triparma retinervis TaxID=2557542 RepID=A0A9W7AI59_9STRA|nr:hypothetical protein TrRE_jg3330 [Triparma retinervis]
MSSPAPPKTKIQFVPVGSAPILTKTKYKLPSTSPFSSVSMFLRRILALPQETGLFIYIGTSFSPNPMELVGEIEKCFSVNGELQVHYCLQEAWG